MMIRVRYDESASKASPDISSNGSVETRDQDIITLMHTS